MRLNCNYHHSLAYMALARMTQSTTKHLFGFGDGFFPNLGLTQRKKYQLSPEKSGFRPFRKWSCGETNLIQTGHHDAVWSLSLPAVISYGIGYRGKQYWQSNTNKKGLQNRGYWQTECAHGMRYVTTNPFEEKQNNIIDEALRGSDVSNPSKVGEKHPRDSESDSDEPNPKRRNLGGVSNLEEIISANALANVMSSDLAVHVDLEKKGDGEYVLNIKRDTQSLTAEDKVERAEQMAQKAAVLLLYGEMLVDMGNKLRVQSLASLCSAFQSPELSNSEYADVE